MHHHETKFFKCVKQKLLVIFYIISSTEIDNIVLLLRHTQCYTLHSIMAASRLTSDFRLTIKKKKHELFALRAVHLTSNKTGSLSFPYQPNLPNLSVCLSVCSVLPIAVCRYTPLFSSV